MSVLMPEKQTPARLEQVNLGAVELHPHPL
jgi:hypothetical protein